ncbi:MAG: DNA alkylation repair protein [Sedimentisphaerales bacterium]|nr:DNA alkylation repair protein [Sedimentisphaerales bacterium]
MVKLVINELEKEIKKISGCTEPHVERRYHKHDQYICYGLKTPDFHKMMKEYRSRFLDISLTERLELAAKLLKTRIGELGHAGIYILSISSDQLEPKHFSILDAAADDFTSWTHVDVLSTKVTPTLLFNFPEQMMDFLDKWNHSQNRFKRRASVVTFIQDVAKSGKYLDDALRLCENLVWDTEDIVRKGVGWTLKVNMDYAQDRVLEYVKDLRRRGVSSTITLYAIEKLPKDIRSEVLKIKKE